MKMKHGISAWLKRIKSTWMPTADDKAWNAWVKFKPRDRADLNRLLNEDGVRDSIKARALFLLLAPEASLVPFHWGEQAEPVVGKFTRAGANLSGLSSGLQQYAAELIIQFVDLLRPMHNPIPDSKCISAQGMAVYWQEPSRYHEALSFYNARIPGLLGNLPEDMANALFERFSLYDVSTFWNMDEASGLGPFADLLRDPSVDERWKHKADTRVRQQILAEQRGEMQPRQEWEGALSCYVDMLRTMLYCERLDYPGDFFASQIAFLLSDELGDAKTHTLDDYLLPRLFRKLEGDSYRELRYRISRSVVYREQNPFTVYSDETVVAAHQMLAEFGEEDAELRQRLSDQLSLYELRQKEAEQRKHEQAMAAHAAAEAERNLIDAMK